MLPCAGWKKKGEREGWLSAYLCVCVSDVGGTSFEGRQALLTRASELKLPPPKIAAYVTHAVFPKDAHTAFLPGGARTGFERFFVTDTVPEVASKLRGRAPFHVLSVLPSVLHDLARATQTAIPSTAIWPRLPRRIVLASTNPSKVSVTFRQGRTLLNPPVSRWSHRSRQCSWRWQTAASLATSC